MLDGKNKFIEQKDVEAIAQKENISLLFKNALYNFDHTNKNSISYVFMILFNYLNKRNIDTFLDDLKKEKFDINALTNIVVSYGFYQGYSAVKARYDDINIKLSLPKDNDVFSYLFDFIFKPDQLNEKIVNNKIGYELNLSDLTKVSDIISNQTISIKDMLTIPSIIEKIVNNIKLFQEIFIENLKKKEAKLKAKEDALAQQAQQFNNELEASKRQATLTLESERAMLTKEKEDALLEQSNPIPEQENYLSKTESQHVLFKVKYTSEELEDRDIDDLKKIAKTVLGLKKISSKLSETELRQKILQNQ